MSMQSYYEVNVTYFGQHFFATAPRSGQGMNETQGLTLFNNIKAQFPESEGFSCTLTYWEGRGYKIDTDKEV